MAQLQYMSMNEIISQFNSSYPSNYSQYSYAIPHIVKKDVTPTCSAPYVSPSLHNSVSYVNNGHSRINENSSSIHTPPYTTIAHTFPTTSASYVAESHSRINGISMNKQYGKQFKTKQRPANEGHNPEGKTCGISISAPGDFQYNRNNRSNWSIKPVRLVSTGQLATRSRREVKHCAIHIRVPCLANIFDKVCFTSILSNFQSNHVSFVDAPISDIMIPNVERLIEGDNLLVSNKINSGCIGQCTVKIRKADSSNILALKFFPSLLPKVLSTWIACGHSEIKTRKPKVKSILIVDANVDITSKVSGPKDPSKDMAEWIDQKSEPFACIALKLIPKNQLKKIKYTFDLTLCDDIFEVLLKHVVIKLPSHKVIPSPHDLEGRVYCKWHNSFDHSTSSCNAFCLVIQSAIDIGRLRFMYLCKDYQLISIDHDDKILSNRQSQANSCKIKNLNVQNASSVISEDTLSIGGIKTSHIWLLTDSRQSSQNLSF
jgi:hypothetical protein